MEQTDYKVNSHFSTLKFWSKKIERKLLKAFLLKELHQLFCQLFESKIQYNHNFPMECYTMDSQVIQFIIQGIVETGEYTLEGIAYYTRIPLDVIYDAACGINHKFSITPWVRIVDLYMQVKPDVRKALINKLLELKDQHHHAFSSILIES